jgi:glycosyltransferase involved in cell wall biosynthesis
MKLHEPSFPEAARSPIDVSVVIPCLDEADTIELCVVQAFDGIRASGRIGEVIVADNGSTDGSVDIAARAGARLVHVATRGYGAALMAGIESARGRWVVMGDADASYDLSEVPRFVAELERGNALVMGCRLPAGGGTVVAGAMPRLHRWLGNPVFSQLARSWFNVPIHDIHCGMRGFTRELYERLHLRCTGMEFASEMAIKAALSGARITEVAITLYPDRRRAHAPHLRTFRDGWRHLRFFLLFSPRWLFGIPGIGLMVVGAVTMVVGFQRLAIGRIGFDVHTLLFGGLFVLLGLQMALFGILAKAYAVSQGLLPPSRLLQNATRWLRLEAGLITGVACGMLGGVLLLRAVLDWWAVGFGELDYSETMRTVIPGVVLAAAGVQIVLTSFLLGVFSLPSRNTPRA